jgi:hypothetical protein
LIKQEITRAMGAEQQENARAMSAESQLQSQISSPPPLNGDVGGPPNGNFIQALQGVPLKGAQQAQLADGQVLKYDAASRSWVPGAGSAGAPVILSGYCTGLSAGAFSGALFGLGGMFDSTLNPSFGPQPCFNGQRPGTSYNGVLMPSPGLLKNLIVQSSPRTGQGLDLTGTKVVVTIQGVLSNLGCILKASATPDGTIWACQDSTDTSLVAPNKVVAVYLQTNLQISPGTPVDFFVSLEKQ